MYILQIEINENYKEKKKKKAFQLMHLESRLIGVARAVKIVRAR